MGANLSYALYMVGQQVLLQPAAAARASRLPNGHGEALARLARAAQLESREVGPLRSVGEAEALRAREPIQGPRGQQ